MRLALRTVLESHAKWLSERHGSGGLSRERLRVAGHYRTMLVGHEIGGVRLGDRTVGWFGPDALGQLQTDLGCRWSARTATNLMAYLMAALRWAGPRYGFTVARWSVRQPPRKDPDLTTAEIVRSYVEKLASGTDSQRDVGRYLAVLYSTGARPGELLKATWADFDGQRITIAGKNTGKTGRKRRIYLGPEAIAALGSPRSGPERIFWRWSRVTHVADAIDAGAKRWGLSRLTLYQVRRLAITEACRVLSVSDVAKLVDSSPRVIQAHYDAVVDDHLRAIGRRFEGRGRGSERSKNIL